MVKHGEKLHMNNAFLWDIYRWMKAKLISDNALYDNSESDDELTNNTPAMLRL